MPNKKKQSSRGKNGKNGHTFSAPFFLLAFIGILAVSAGLWFVLGQDRPGLDVIVEEPIDLDVLYTGERHPLSGVRIEGDDAYEVFAVMVENSVDAWPLSGIEDSYLVYEAPVEGNITRFMVMYSGDQKIDEIGPVRSARPYYVDIVLGWNALYVHVGGSPESLELIADRGVNDLNEFYNGGSFWRSRRNAAPHNVYTATSRLISAWEKKDIGDQKYESRLVKDIEPEKEDRPEAHEVEVVFNGYGYDVTWEYDPETNAYTRYQAGSEYKLRSGESIVVKNVAIMKTSTSVIDSIGRQKITTAGNGDATFLIDGQIINGRWEKDSRDDLERFYDSDGDEIEWNVGKSWVHIVDENKNADL